MQTRSKTKKANKGQASTSAANPPSPPSVSTRGSINSNVPLAECIDTLRGRMADQNPPRAQGNAPPQMREDERPVADFIIPTVGSYGSPISLLEGEEHEFELKSGLIHMVHGNQYDGYGNPNKHLELFTEICRTYRNPGIRIESMYMRVFPLSLTGRAKEWLNSHEPNSFQTWKEVASAFLMQFFPPKKTKKMREKISCFEQEDDKDFYDAYERFKGLLRECPHHSFTQWQLLSFFYDGMDQQARNHMDQSSGGSINGLGSKDGFKIIEKLIAIVLYAIQKHSQSFTKLSRTRLEASLTTSSRISVLNCYQRAFCVSIISGVELAFQHVVDAFVSLDKNMDGCVIKSEMIEAINETSSGEHSSRMAMR